ncbi:MAG: GH32 C-terminal domain-containing protein [Bacteroidota bacterium]
MIKSLLIILAFCFVSHIEAQTTYAEYYRPQYHLSPQWGGMGDPNGMIYFDGKYHLMWWGHALSDDLVHWVEYSNFAMKGGPGGFGYWSGSVVADINNSAGFNTIQDTALVAIYTMHYDATAYEKVGISSSLNHIGFDYYAGNPVINADQKDFRDPSVFWYEPTKRWIMVIAKAVDRKIELYSSLDLKTWQFLSSFNNRGAKDQVWETPDLIELPLNNDPLNKKWVMTCGMGPNKMQYWVGNFDGTSFQLDTLDNLYTGNQVPGELFEGFESGNFGNWQITGDAFGSGPASGTLPNQQQVNSYLGKSFVNSYHNGDISTGKMISPDFQIQKRHINFLIGGGSNSLLKISLYVDGIIVASSTSQQNQETLRWNGWNVSQWKGKTAHIEIVDDATGGWGHILVDQLMFSDVLYDSHIEHANWVDWGRDFYAARAYRNYSINNKDRTVWIAWLGNWTYARSVPTNPWQGSESIPRTMQLINQGEGYQLIQHPIEELNTLRNEHYSIGNTLVSGNKPLDGIQPKWNVFELKASFKIDSKNQVFGINLAVNDSSGQKLIIGYDAGTSQIYIDRRKAGLVNFNQAFPTIMYAPTPIPADSIIDFHIYMDQSSVEVFANNYQTVLTALVYTKPTTTGISLFSDKDDATLLNLEIWKMNSIWGITPDQLPNAVPESETGGQGYFVYPNPLKEGDVLTFKTESPQLIDHGLIKLTDLYGRVVFNQVINKKYLSEIQIKGLPAKLAKGQYILQLQSDSFNRSRKIIIQ